jgi:hypothetical protein
MHFSCYLVLFCSDSHHYALYRAQVVGWPPVRNYRKNTLAANAATKIKAEGQAKSEAECCYVKVSMDGAPYLRKVDLKTYSSYENLSLELEKMFSCFIAGERCCFLSRYPAIQCSLLYCF